MSDHIAGVGKMVGAQDVIAAAIWQYELEIAGAPAQVWQTWSQSDPETAAIYQTHAGCVLAALSAAGLVVEQGWQPIETAPRDGTWIWCWHEEKRWKRVGMRCKASGPRWYYSGTGFNAEYADDAPTHWRPLPAAPQEASDDGS